MFSVVIPTLNEEKNLRKLLKQIQQQTLKPSEIIVADKSTDNTPNVAREFGAKVVVGTDDYRIGKGRNNGAKHAKERIIVFLDADGDLRTKDFFSKLIGNFIKKDLDVATCYFSPDKKNIRNIILYSGYNALKKFSEITKGVIAEGAACVVVKKEVFQLIGGFSEKLKVGEDVEFIRRALENDYKYGVIGLLIKTSARKFTNRGAMSNLATLVGGIGVLFAGIYGIKRLSKYLSKFEDFYWNQSFKSPGNSEDTDEDGDIIV